MLFVCSSASTESCICLTQLTEPSNFLRATESLHNHAKHECIDYGLRVRACARVFYACVMSKSWPVLIWIIWNTKGGSADSFCPAVSRDMIQLLLWSFKNSIMSPQWLNCVVAEGFRANPWFKMKMKINLQLFRSCSFEDFICFIERHDATKTSVISRLLLWLQVIIYLTFFSYNWTNLTIGADVWGSKLDFILNDWRQKAPLWPSVWLVISRTVDLLHFLFHTCWFNQTQKECEPVTRARAIEDRNDYQRIEDVL